MKSKPNVTFQIETFRDVYQEAIPLLANHWQEVAPFPEVCILNPDIPTYYNLEDQGKLVVVTARDGEKLVGYIWLLIHFHLHYRSVLVGTDDIHYLDPDYRKGWTGVRLIRFAEQVMKDRKVDIAVLRCKFAKNHGKIFEYLGYTATDAVYLKKLRG